jgi:hypothetical protein
MYNPTLHSTRFRDFYASRQRLSASAIATFDVRHVGLSALCHPRNLCIVHHHSELERAHLHSGSHEHPTDLVPRRVGDIEANISPYLDFPKAQLNRSLS